MKATFCENIILDYMNCVSVYHARKELLTFLWVTFVENGWKCSVCEQREINSMKHALLQWHFILKVAYFVIFLLLFCWYITVKILFCENIILDDMDCAFCHDWQELMLVPRTVWYTSYRLFCTWNPFHETSPSKEGIPL